MRSIFITLRGNLATVITYGQGLGGNTAMILLLYNTNTIISSLYQEKILAYAPKQKNLLLLQMSFLSDQIYFYFLTSNLVRRIPIPV